LEIVMKVFYTPSSPYVRKVSVVALETGYAIDVVPAAARPTNRDANVVAKNPLGKIPTAVLDDGTALYDSRVITRWLDAQHSGPPLYPEGDALWPVLRREATADGMLDAALLIRYEIAQRPEALRWPDWIRGQQDKIHSGFEHLEREAPDFVGIDAGLIAIACAIGFIDFRLPDWGWREGCPTLATWYREFIKRPSLQATMPTDQGR
jgi:glutathione S-transferase